MDGSITVIVAQAVNGSGGDQWVLAARNLTYYGLPHRQQAILLMAAIQIPADVF